MIDNRSHRPSSRPSGSQAGVVRTPPRSAAGLFPAGLFAAGMLTATVFALAATQATPAHAAPDDPMSKPAASPSSTAPQDPAKPPRTAGLVEELRVKDPARAVARTRGWVLVDLHADW